MTLSTIKRDSQPLPLPPPPKPQAASKPPAPPAPPPPPPPAPKPQRGGFFGGDTVSRAPQTTTPNQSRSQLLAMDGVVTPSTTAPATTLLTENTRDGQRNCLDAVGDWLALATPQLRARSEVLLLRDTRSGAQGSAGHAVIRQGESIFDPSTGRTYANFKEFNAAGNYQLVHTTSGAAMNRVLSAPPGSAERQKALEAARIPASVQNMLLADTNEGRPLTADQQAALDAAVKALPPYPSAQQIGALIHDQDAFWLDSGEENPQAFAALTTAMASRYAPPRGPQADLQGFNSAMEQLSVAAGGFTPQMSAALATAAMDPALAARGVHTGEVAAWALKSATTPDAAQAVLDAIGPDRMESFITSLGLNPANSSDPTFMNSGSRMLALRDFMNVAANLATHTSAPNGAQARFFLTVAQQAGPMPLEQASFREALGKGLGAVYAMGNPTLAATESARMGELLRNGHVGDLLQGATAEQRQGLYVAFLDNPQLTSRLVDHHNGNLATAVAFIQLESLTHGLTGAFGPNGQVPLGADGQPLIPPDAQIPTPPPDVLARHPAIAALGTPLHAATVAQAIQAGKLTSAQAADYLDDLATYSSGLANPDLARHGADGLTSAAINVLNGGNPIENSRLNEYAALNANSLSTLADQVRASNDPAYIAQAMTAGSTQDATFRASLPRYGDAIAAMGENVHGRRRAIIAGVGMVASMAAPILAAAAIPAGATLTVGGVTLGTATLQAGTAGLTTSVVSTALNAGNMYDATGQLHLGNAVAGGVVDGLTTYFGMRLSIIASARGQGAMSALVRGAAIDGMGGVGAYALGTPGALEGILNGDPKYTQAAAIQGGVSFGSSFVLSSLLELPGVDTQSRPGNIVADGIGVLTPMPRFGASAAGSRVHGYRGIRDIVIDDLETIINTGLHPRAVRAGRMEEGAIESLPFFQRFWMAVKESAGKNVGENVVMLTRNPGLAEAWARNTPVNSEGQVSWLNFSGFVAGLPKPSRAEYFTPQQFELLRAQQLAAGGPTLLVKDSNGTTVQMTLDQVRQLMGNKEFDITAEVAAPVENQIGLASFYGSTKHQEEPIVGSIGADGIITLTVLYEGTLP
ncbi:hypothetical protein [Myxococcus landrumensis]|uniref:Uncharacterized protein n=1 Tax=Myxococcus landrumensis TaxID=2813577 RepID=A0ABX7N5X2_9BACT|nr:hypothetical protein [Myxococcus landrumus]QSQ14144.1 hypothetical protein JY572_38515 [Myxococcus landrumus]